MYSFIQKRKIVAILVILSFSTLSIFSAPAHAKMINTDEILKQRQHDLSRKSINKRNINTLPIVLLYPDDLKLNQ